MSEFSGLPSQEPNTGIDSSVPHSARIWNYWIGGKDCYAVDRELGEQVREVYPQIVDIARADRAFLARAVRYLVQEAGIRQFLDIGTGLPTGDNTHQVAQRLNPECRIVYVDNDPMVLAHARALLVSTPEGATDYLHADLREPEEILHRAADTLDFDQPIAVMLLGILIHLEDKNNARAIVDRLMAGVPSGSYLAIADDLNTDPQAIEVAQHYSEQASAPVVHHTPEEFDAYFASVDVVPPGVVPSNQWHPDRDTPTAELINRAGVGRKP